MNPIVIFLLGDPTPNPQPRTSNCQALTPPPILDTSDMRAVCCPAAGRPIFPLSLQNYPLSLKVPEGLWVSNVTFLLHCLLESLPQLNKVEDRVEEIVHIWADRVQ